MSGASHSRRAVQVVKSVMQRRKIDKSSAPADQTKKNVNRWSPEARSRQQQTKEERKKNSLLETIPEAGARLGLGVNASYDAAKRDNWPIVKTGKNRKGVPKVFIDKLIELTMRNFEQSRERLDNGC